MNYTATAAKATHLYFEPLVRIYRIFKPLNKEKVPVAETPVQGTLSHKQQKHLNVLERRANYLERRIQNSDKDLSFDKQELAALRWAISRIDPATKQSRKKQHEAN